MVFSDQAFLFLFLPPALIAGLLFAWRANPALILLPSLLFYYWSAGAAVLLLLVSIGINFTGGLAIERTRRKSVLVAVVALNLALLIYFKYTAFLLATLDNLGSGRVEAFARHIVLPIGISFFTFQGISYVVDIWRGVVRAEPNLVTFAAYKAFFPQLIAGPIVRYSEVKEDLKRPRLSSELFAAGAARFVLGLCKKVVIADQVAGIADAAFGLPAAERSFASGWLGATAYAVQIYFDFSGYSDMAIGLAMMFGIRFRENFDHPYAAATLTEFWRRWHISLSTWFRDYLYVPLGGSRVGTARTYLNLALVFVATGIWHGAAWTFLFWGVYHGAFLILEKLLLPKRKAAPAWLRFVYFLPVVLVGWVLFRAENMTQFLAIAAELATPWQEGAMAVAPGLARALDPVPAAMLMLGGGAALMQRQLPPLGPILARSGSPLGSWLRFGAVTAGSLVAAVLVLPQHFSPFLYFRF